MSAGLQGIIGLRALSALSNLRTNGLPLVLVSGVQPSLQILQRTRSSVASSVLSRA